MHSKNTQNFQYTLENLSIEKNTNIEESDPILSEIIQVTNQLSNVKARFDFETDDDMIDACIFEERALLSRYSFLLSLAKQKGLCQSPVNKILSAKQINT
jgi:hypothetical protein